MKILSFFAFGNKKGLQKICRQHWKLTRKSPGRFLCRFLILNHKENILNGFIQCTRNPECKLKGRDVFLILNRQYSLSGDTCQPGQFFLSQRFPSTKLFHSVFDHKQITTTSVVYRVYCLFPHSKRKQSCLDNFPPVNNLIHITISIYIVF